METSEDELQINIPSHIPNSCPQQQLPQTQRSPLATRTSTRSRQQSRVQQTKPAAVTPASHQFGTRPQHEPRYESRATSTRDPPREPASPFHSRPEREGTAARPHPRQKSKKRKRVPCAGGNEGTRPEWHLSSNDHGAPCPYQRSSERWILCASSWLATCKKNRLSPRVVAWGRAGDSRSPERSTIVKRQGRDGGSLDCSDVGFTTH